MIRAASHATLVWFARILGGALLVFGLLAWRLTVEPVSLDALIPWVQETVGRDEGPRLELGGLELAWSEERSRVDLVVRDVRIAADDGKSRMTLSRAAVGLSLKSLLEGRIRPTRMEASHPRAFVILRRDGSVDLTPDDTGDAGGAAAAGLLAALGRPPDAGATLGLLRDVSLVDAELTVIDEAVGRKYQLRGVTLDAKRNDGGIEGAGRLVLDVDGRSAGVEIPRLTRRIDGTVAVTARIAGADPAMPAPWFPAAARLEGRVDAAIEAEVAPDFTVRRWTADIRAAEIAETVGGARRALTDAAVRLSGDHERSTIAAEGVRARLGDVAIAGDGAFDPTARVGRFDARVGDGAARITVDSAPDSQTSVEVALDGIDAVRIARAIGDPAPLDAAPPLSGSIRVTVDRDGAPTSAAVDVSVGAGTLSVPGVLPRPMEVRSAALVAEVDPKARALRVSRAFLDGDGPTIAASGGARDDGRSIAIDAKVNATRIVLDDLAKWWPERVKANMRRWMTENLSAGVIDEVDTTMSGTSPSDDPGDFTLGQLDGHLSGRDGSVVYLRPLPKVEGVERIEGVFSGRTLTITTHGGHVGEVTAGDGRIVLVNLGTPREDIDIEIPLRGPIRTVLDALDMPPFRYPTRLNVETDKTSGQAEATLRFAFPLFESLKLEDIRINVDGKIAQATIKGLAKGRDVTDGALGFQLDTRGIQAKGKVKIAGVPATVDWREIFEPTGRDPRTRLGVRARLDPDALAKLGVAPPRDLGGTADLDSTLTIDAKRGLRIAGKLDLTQSEFKIPALSIRKARGEAADARFVIDPATKPDQPTTVDLKAHGDAFDVSAVLGIGDDGRLRFARQAKVAAGANDFTADIARDGDAYRATVSGSGIDLTALTADDSGDDKNRTSFQAAFDLRRVVFGPGRELTGVRGEARRSTTRWEAYDLTATTKGGGSLVASLRPDRTGVSILAIKAADAGAVMDAIDVTDRVRGGVLVVEGRRGAGAKDPLAGTVEMTAYRVVDAPVLARLLNVMSLSGLSELLEGQGLGFDRLSGEFSFDGDRLTVRKTRTSGGALGLTVDGEVDLRRKTMAMRGTMVPIYSFNRILGQIPFLGDLLSGGEGQGLFAATWSAEGSFDDPRVAVNPLAVLAPGFLRNLFFLGEEPTTTSPK